MHHSRRRKKQRPSYGKRLVDVYRSVNGFGFTISGQQPCILSCIVPNSPADTAGLRTGDFLISVNGTNVSRLPHEVVVQLINDSVGTIRLAIAENYFSDTSDEDTNFGWQNENSRGAQEGRSRRPKYQHHKVKMVRSQQQTRRKTENEPMTSVASGSFQNSITNPDQLDSISAYNIIHSAHASNDRDIKNVSAMVSSPKSDNNCDEPSMLQLEYRTVVGYLGTIEMPKQIVSNSKFQTVRSCIRKMRQEKRTPTVVLMQILPNCLKLYNADNVLLAKYPTARLSYVSSNNNTGNGAANSDGDTRFFGLVTSSTYNDGKVCEWAANSADPSKDPEVLVSSSCHVFVIDLKLIEHADHFTRAEQFSIVCTRDPVTNCCLEFPSTSEYVVNLIRIMYALNSDQPVQRPGIEIQNRRSVQRVGEGNARHQHLRHRNNDANGRQNSPQPSNHSEITTTSSNSDSGIGFHNDFANVSDRIVLVDFPYANEHGQQRARLPNNPQQNIRFSERPVPFGAESVRNIRSTTSNQAINDVPKPIVFHAKSRSLDYTLNDENHLAGPSRKSMPSPTVHLVRAMPDRYPTTSKMPLQENCASLPNSPIKYERYETIFGTDSEKTISDQATDQQDTFQSGGEDGSECRSNSAMLMARSCDDLMITARAHNFPKTRQVQQLLASLDDVSLLGDAPPPPLPHRSKINNKLKEDENDDYVFLAPQAPPLMKKVKKKKSSSSGDKSNGSKGAVNDILSYKLSPKVFGVAKPNQTNNKQINKAKRRLSIDPKPEGEKKIACIKNRDFSVWGSLQDLEMLNRLDIGSSADQRVCRRDFMEPAYSEPDLLTRTLPNTSSPFRRWGQSSFRSRSNDLTPANLINRRPSSLVASENDVYSKSVDNDVDTCSLKSKGSDGTSSANIVSTNRTAVTAINSSTSHGVHVWGNSFEKLLEDAAGLHTFAEFLKKEYSAENIYFWTACERYRKLNDQAERTKEANAIFSKHLAIGASEPVNVDSKARTLAQDGLNYAEQDLFMQAQKQIFNLMKFDSYQRFIRSDMYKTCLVAEQQKQPLPYPGNQLDPNLRTSVEAYEKVSTVTSSKLKKSLSNAEDRRRKSLLPWHRKTRCKSKDRNEEFLRNEALKNGTTNSHLTTNINQSQNDIHSSRSSLSSFDAVISSRANGSISPIGSNEDSPPRSSLCRVILSDGATTIVQTRHHESIRNLIDRLLEKRGIFYGAYEGFVAGTNKPIDLNMPSTSVAGNEVLIEQRVVFKLDLPNKKIISVKSKPCKIMSEVLKPILHKYNYQLEMVTVYSKSNSEPLPMNTPVTSADGLRLQVVFNDDVLVSAQETTLNEITNKVFNELMQKKTDLQSKNLDISHVTSLQTNQIQHQQLPIQQHEDMNGRSDDWCSESSSGNFGQLRQPIFKGRANTSKHRKFSVTPSSSNVSLLTSISSKDNTSISSKTITEESASTSFNGISNEEASKKPLIAKWKTGVRLQNTSSPSPDSKDLLEGLKRAQRFRLEDQRGTEINFELPDFLKDNNTNKWKSIKTPSTDVLNSKDSNDIDAHKKPPQPAPRLSINRNHSQSSCGEISYENGEKSQYSSHSQGSDNSDTSPHKYSNGTLPPPLPPKPKMKPSTWAGNSNWQLNDSKMDSNDAQNLLAHSIRNVKAPIADRINMLSATIADKKMPQPRTIYFDRMNSSFV